MERSCSSSITIARPQIGKATTAKPSPPQNLRGQHYRQLHHFWTPRQLHNPPLITEKRRCLPLAYIMSRQAQVEEVYDSDPEEVAPSDDELPPPLTDQSILSGAGVPPPGGSASIPMRPAPEPQREIPRHYQCLYPVYFDKTRSRAEGRKVGAELAVENPLARDIVDAAQMLGLQVGLEPEKLHPKDWANPGRVRVLLKNEGGKLANPKIKNSKFLHYSWRIVLVCLLGRTSPLYPRRAIPQSQSHHRAITLPLENQRSPHARETPRCSPSAQRLENRQDPPHTLSCIQRRRRQ